MIKALLIIRLNQTFRNIIEIGLFRMIFLIGLIGFLVFALYIKTAESLASQYISIGFLLLILLIQLQRKDKLFLKSHFSNYKILMLSEYLLLSTPILVCLLIHKQWFSVFELLGLLIIVHFDLKQKRKSLNTKLQEMIPIDCIEWKAGLRKQFFIIVPIWIIGAITSFFIGSVPIVIFILGISTFTFFERNESSQILLSYELNSQKLLWLKIKRQLQLFFIMVIPLIALFLVFHVESWYIPIVEYIIFCFLHIYVIVTKYAFYEPNTKPIAAQTFGGIGALGGIIPIFLPLVWLLTIWFYLKSINNLNLYLDDYN